MPGGVTALIGVDWGTTNLRALRIGADGAVLERRIDARGAGGLARDDFAAVLEAVAGDWLAEGLPALVCGMAGARHGWIEAPYVACPTGAAEIAAMLVRPDERRDIRVVPGVALRTEGLGDVMRGEETQAVGLFDQGECGLLLAPGTHAKWIRVVDGRIGGFRTFLTGELFAALRSATMVGRDLGDPGRDDEAFDAGVRQSLAEPALTAHLFNVRVRRLAETLTPDGAADFLSGLLLGAEAAAAGADDRARPVTIVGDGQLTARYRRALSIADFTTVAEADGEAAVARGLLRIWKAAA